MHGHDSSFSGICLRMGRKLYEFLPFKPSNHVLWKLVSGLHKHILTITATIAAQVTSVAVKTVHTLFIHFAQTNAVYHGTLGIPLAELVVSPFYPQL